MVLRAILVLFLIWLLVPHEPNLGYGRPGADRMNSPLAWLKSHLRIEIERHSAEPRLPGSDSPATSILTVKLELYR